MRFGYSSVMPRQRIRYTAKCSQNNGNAVQTCTTLRDDALGTLTAPIPLQSVNQADVPTIRKFGAIPIKGQADASEVIFKHITQRNERQSKSVFHSHREVYLKVPAEDRPAGYIHYFRSKTAEKNPEMLGGLTPPKCLSCR
jgi:hypothetical protein